MVTSSMSVASTRPSPRRRPRGRLGRLCQHGRREARGQRELGPDGSEVGTVPEADRQQPWRQRRQLAGAVGAQRLAPSTGPSSHAASSGRRPGDHGTAPIRGTSPTAHVRGSPSTSRSTGHSGLRPIASSGVDEQRVAASAPACRRTRRPRRGRRRGSTSRGPASTAPPTPGSRGPARWSPAPPRPPPAARARRRPAGRTTRRRRRGSPRRADGALLDVGDAALGAGVGGGDDTGARPQSAG